MMIRPEDFDVVPNGMGDLNDAIVKSVQYKGLLWDVTFEHQGQEMHTEAINNVTVDGAIGLKVDPEDIHLIKMKE